jgi:glycosyltransferase involved in cell wall biosynthesis
MTKKGSLIWKIGRRIENYTYRNADKIIVISEGFKKNIMEKGVPEEKIVVIPNWVDTDSVYPIDRKDNILFDRYGLDREKFYICYSGNIGHSQNLDMLIEVAKELSFELPEVGFVLIGEGAAKETLVERVEKEGITNVRILPFQPYEEISHVFSLGDAGLIISKPGIGESSVPSKTWSIMAAERPVLASFDKESELYKLVEKPGCGLASDASSKDDFKRAVRKLYSNAQMRFEMGKCGRDYLEEELNKDKCVGEYVKIINEMLATIKHEKAEI